MTAEYNEAQIQVLEGLDAVRMRPGMYIGSTSSRGLHHLVDEIVDNAIDEALAGFCTRIEVAIEPGEVVRVVDDGRGIPVGLHPELGIPTPQVVYTKLHAGGKFGSGGYKVSGGLHGVGASVVNALSEWLEVTVRRDGYVWTQRFERGVPATGLVRGAATRQRGTEVRFRPDDLIFAKVRFQTDQMAKRLRELAFLNPGLVITLTDERPLPEDAGPDEQPFSAVFDYPGGVADFVTAMNDELDVLHAPIVFSGRSGDIEVEVAMQYNDGYGEVVASFCNCIRTQEGGQHETGFKVAHTRVMNEYARKLGIWKKKDNLSGSDVREGVMVVLNLRMTNAEFEGQTKTKLGNVEARSVVEEITASHLAAYLDEHPEVARAILEKAAKASQARVAAHNARKAVRTGKSSKVRTSLDGKLTRCSSKKAELNEVFIVEGDSAGGSAKLGRDREHQAILPIKGKPLNTERATLSKVLSNKEILAIVQAIGAGVASDFDLSESNYARVIILADADDDGAHIRCLLLTFFYRFMKPLLEDGRIFIAQPPLYKIERTGRKSEHVYAWTDDELAEQMKKWRGKNVVVQRYKGLGEMDPTQLWDTTLNPATRTLLRVTLEEGALAERQVRVLMGSKAEPRKHWITDNVRFGDDLGPATRL